jgi:hypothetical protein
MEPIDLEDTGMTPRWMRVTVVAGQDRGHHRKSQEELSHDGHES